jgi:hypothetical protein
LLLLLQWKIAHGSNQKAIFLPLRLARPVSISKTQQQQKQQQQQRQLTLTTKKKGPCRAAVVWNGLPICIARTHPMLLSEDSTSTGMGESQNTNAGRSLQTFPIFCSHRWNGALSMISEQSISSVDFDSNTIILHGARFHMSIMSDIAV